MNNEPYKVSICVPIYGVEKYIERCAESLFGQTYENIEYVFVDDCTPDNSIELLRKVIEKYQLSQDSIRIIRHEHNKGLGEARNTAVSASTGEFIMHVDSDDYIDRNCVRCCVDQQIKSGADVVSVGIVKMFASGNQILHIPQYITPADLNISLIRHTIPNNIWGRLIRRRLYTDNKIKVENVNMSEDLNVLPRLLYYANKIAIINKSMYYYECSNIASYTASFSEDKCNQILKTLALLKDFFTDKENIYKDAVGYRTINSWFGMAKDCVLFKGALGSEYYSKLLSLPVTVPHFRWRHASLPVKIGLKLRSSYFLFSIYVRCAKWLHNIYKRIIKNNKRF